MNEPNSKLGWGGTEERISELQDRTVEITQSEQQRENRLEKMNKAIRTCGTITTDVIFVSMSEGEGKENWTEKVLEKIMAEKFANLARDINL